MSSIDRLSDDVICHILSFLPTKASASTNVLSKRWRFLWAHVPNLNFKGDDFKVQWRASDIITRAVVLHRAKTIITFSLSRMKCDCYQIDTWISHAVNRGVRNFYLDFTNPKYTVKTFTPPRCLLTCTTLVDLKLRHCRGIIPSSGNLFLPSLKKLHLSRIMYEDNESLPRMLFGCPVLEDLVVEGCFMDKKIASVVGDGDDDLGCVLVSSPTIKTLNVDLLEGFPNLKINAPSLVYLKVNNCFLEDITICLGTMTSLIEADLYLNIEQDPYEYDEKCILYDTQFLICLCNLKCLRISMEFLEAVLINIATLSSLVKFDNLTKLELHLFSLDFHDLVKFLQFADNLESLCFSLGGIFYTYKEPKQVPTCMLSRLKIVRIKPFFGFNEHVFETIRFFFWNAQVLERMEIYSNSYCSSNEVELEMLGRISLLERGSESCELAFY